MILILITAYMIRFVVRIPDSLPMDAAAPLLCAGITVFAPMKQHNMLEAPGKKLGVVGLGGLGHVAVKFGKAFGLHVTVISTSPSKEKEAMGRLGADDFLLSTNPKQMQVQQLLNRKHFECKSAPMTEYIFYTGCSEEPGLHHRHRRVVPFAGADS